MGDRPAVTIAIPFYDEERYLAGAVRSILAQTMTDFELLLVDDGSRDRSLDIARAFDDPRIIVLSDGRHVGLAARLNEITHHARADLVARMDADDVCHPTRIARELEVLGATRCDAVGTWAGLFDEQGEVFAVVESTALPPTRASAFAHGILAHATMVARRSWLLANPYDESLMRAEDRDLWCRTVSSSTFAVVPEPLYAVRVGERADEDFTSEYAYAQRLNRQLFLRHGPAAVGRARTARAWLLSLAKTGVMGIATRLGAANRLVRRRGRAPSVREEAMILESLRLAAEPFHGVADLGEHDVVR